jgi:hypothetical protein
VFTRIFVVFFCSLPLLFFILSTAWNQGHIFTVVKDPKRLSLCNKLCPFCFTCSHTVSLSGEKHSFQCIKQFQDTILNLFLCATLQAAFLVAISWNRGGQLDQLQELHCRRKLRQELCINEVKYSSPYFMAFLSSSSNYSTLVSVSYGSSFFRESFNVLFMVSLLCMWNTWILCYPKSNAQHFSIWMCFVWFHSLH